MHNKKYNRRKETVDMNSDLKSALDFAIGYGSVENLEKDYKFQRRIYRIITLIELIICGVILAIKFH